MRKPLRFGALVAVALCTLALAGTSSAKGKLETFEDEVRRDVQSDDTGDQHDGDHDRRHGHRHEHSSSPSAGEIAASSTMSVLNSFFLMGLMGDGSGTSGELYRELKESRSAALPTIRIEPSYQYLVDNIHGAIGKVEFGYLSFGADAEYIRYFESDAPDMTILSGHFLLRTLFARVIGVNLALGAKSIWVNSKSTGFDFGFPFYLYLTRYMTIDVQPAIAFINNTRVYDMAAGVSFHHRFIGARVAYRGIYTGGQTLQGPQVGVFLQW
jgi:hypothetical protein